MTQTVTRPYRNQFQGKHRPIAQCLVCEEPSATVVCRRCRKEHSWGSCAHPSIVFPLALRPWWPDIGAGSTVARSIRESA